MPKFKAGDIIYSQLQQYYSVSKVLVVDSLDAGGNWDCYHICLFEKTPHLPTPENIRDLHIRVMHAPIDPAGMDEECTLVTNVPVSDKEMEGYYTYLQMTDFGRYLEITGRDPEQVLGEANGYYRAGCAAHDLGRLDDAIENYTRAYQIFPPFYEAMDNKGFAFMEQGKMEAAAEMFRESLDVNSDGKAALFSLGECMLKLGRPKDALPFFEEGVRRWPDRKEFQDFLAKTQKLASGN